MPLLENAELGAAASVDFGSRIDDKVLDFFGVDDDSFLRTIANANNTSFAPSVYAEQVERDPALSYSSTLNNTSDPERRQQLAEAAGISSEQAGGLEKALSNTVDQAAEFLGTTGSTLTKIAIGAGVVVGLASLAYLASKVAR